MTFVRQTKPTQVGPLDPKRLKHRPPPTQARGGDALPNVPLIDQDGKVHHFREDLLEGRVVVLNFFSIAGEATFPAMAHMARIARHLGPALGRDCFIHSITTNLDDIPARLARFGQALGRHPGWNLYTALPRDIEAIGRRFYHAYGHRHGQGGHPARLVHYGNAAAGVWGAFGIDSALDVVRERLTWVRAGTPPEGGLRRAGPRRLAGDYQHQNRQV